MSESKSIARGRERPFSLVSMMSVAGIREVRKKIMNLGENPFFWFWYCMRDRKNNIRAER